MSESAYRRTDGTVFETRIRQLNEALWPSFSERVGDLNNADDESIPSRDQAMRSKRPSIPARKAARNEGFAALKSDHTAHTASSIRKMDDFVRTLFQQPAKLPRKVDRSSLRPVLTHVLEMEKTVGMLQQEHTNQIKLESESQKTFDFMKDQITSLRKAFGILSEVLIDEVEDIRGVVNDHVKNVASFLDEAKYRGKLSLDDRPDHDSTLRIRQDMDKKIAILHNNMLQLQTAIEETQAGTKRDLETIREDMQEQFSNAELQLMNVAQSTSKPQQADGIDDMIHVIESNSETIAHLERSLVKVQDDVLAGQKQQGETVKSLYSDIAECVNQQATLREHLENQSMNAVLPADLDALEVNIESIGRSVQEILTNNVTRGPIRLQAGPDFNELLSQAQESSRHDLKVASDHFTTALNDLRGDLDQIEESVISGFEALSVSLKVPNPLQVFEKNDAESAHDDSDDDGSKRTINSRRSSIEPFD